MDQTYGPRPAPPFRARRERQPPTPAIPARRTATPGAAHRIRPAPMKRGFYTIMAAQFFSSLADNALLIAAIQLLDQLHGPA